VAALLDRLSTTIDALIALDLTRLCRGDLLELLRGWRPNAAVYLLSITR